MNKRTNKKQSNGATGNRRAEKMSALAALLGPEAMERLRLQEDGFEDASAPLTKDSEDRVAWHRNRLLERLRHQWSGERVADETPGEVAAALPPQRRAPDPKPDPTPTPPVSIDARIASAVDLARLGAEHPAVIVRVLENMDRAQRVAVLKALPGHTARAAIYRLKSR